MPVTPADLHRTLLARRRGARAVDEARRDAAVRAAGAVAVELVTRGLVERAWLIGSAAWGGFGPRSDVDVVLGGLAASDRVTAEQLFAERVGSEVGVDVLRWEELPEPFRERVAREGVRIA